ncbi:MAG TPA: carboxypeptidase-like regulatory domain-containing protein, partial [Bryobacteraceae bacterium]|nr:carboxypeptidase-like regulatory domain-containing protein [Bryobacteraceae bacterium]
MTKPADVRNVSTLRKLITVTILTVLIAVSAVAQLNRGTITGTVTDSTGAVIAGARIQARNTATSAVYESQSTDAG